MLPTKFQHQPLQKKIQHQYNRLRSWTPREMLASNFIISYDDLLINYSINLLINRKKSLVYSS